MTSGLGGNDALIHMVIIDNCSAGVNLFLAYACQSLLVMPLEVF